MQGPLVSLVNHHDRVRRHVGLVEEGAEQHPVRHVLDDRAVGRAVLETDVVADLVAELHAHLLGHAGGHGHRGNAPRLRAPDLADLCVAHFVEELGNLRGLAGARFTHNDQDLVVPDRLEQRRSIRVHRQAQPVLLQLVGLTLHFHGGPIVALSLGHVVVVLVLRLRLHAADVRRLEIPAHHVCLYELDGIADDEFILCLILFLLLPLLGAVLEHGAGDRRILQLLLLVRLPLLVVGLLVPLLED
mmetsp:Transcript_119154/g.337785  ORF Transcript_119154/g.337785 Transcript_119154/m.337785 type:complete len:245 (+) Transcript_119154:1642-2376(+)